MVGQQQSVRTDEGTRASIVQPHAGKAAECLSVGFCAPDSPGAVRTGYPMVAHLRYRVTTAIANAIFRISVYWPSGYLCAQLTNESSGFGLALEPGHGEITFECPVLPIQPGLYRVDLVIESEGREVDSRQHCATLCVEAGKSAMGDFYIQNVCRIGSCERVQ